jgi:hypothetical protein
MRKLLDGFNKIKIKFEHLKENISLSPEEIKKKDLKHGLEYLINEFSNLEGGRKLDEELDYYYRASQAEMLDNPILMVAVVGFHHKKGSIVEFTHPPQEEIIKIHYDFFHNMLIKNKETQTPEIILDDILNQLTYQCLPDAVHTTNEDAQFFFIQNTKTLLYGISCYRQLKTKSTEIDDDNFRDCVQKAICIVSKLPLFGHFYSKLNSTISVFFDQNTLKDKLIMQELYANYESLSFKNVNTSEIFMSFSLRKLFMFCKDKLFALLKMILLEKKIVVYSHVSNNVCSFILSLISLIPGNFLFNLNIGNSVINYKVSINKI